MGQQALSGGVVMINIDEDDFDKIETSEEVYSCIHIKHGKELEVFGTFSNPDADPRWGTDICSMYTEYGFKGCKIPILAAETAWRQEVIDGKIKNGKKTHTYWICIPRGYDDKYL